jgi:undecaprenyl-diphosphatase
MKSLLYKFDSSITNTIVSWPVALKSFFLFVTALGDPIVTIGIGVVVVMWGYLHMNLRLALAGVVVWLTLSLGSFLKLLFGRSRPLTDYVANLQFHTQSFPSGHTTGSTIAYGLLAYLAWHLLPQPWNYIITSLLVLLIIAIGISRVYLGAHFPSDVVAGWILGSLALLIVIFVLKPISS